MATTPCTLYEAIKQYDEGHPPFRFMFAGHEIEVHGLGREERSENFLHELHTLARRRQYSHETYNADIKAALESWSADTTLNGRAAFKILEQLVSIFDHPFCTPLVPAFHAAFQSPTYGRMIAKKEMNAFILSAVQNWALDDELQDQDKMAVADLLEWATDRSLSINNSVVCVLGIARCDPTRVDAYFDYRVEEKISVTAIFNSGDGRDLKARLTRYAPAFAERISHKFPSTAAAPVEPAA